MKNTRSNHKQHTFSKQKDQSKFDAIINSALLGVLITIGISLLLLLFATAIAISFPDPLSLISPIGYVSLFVSAFFGGFVCSKLNKRAAYLSSTLCGCIFVIISMIISFAIPHTLASEIDIFTRILLHLLSLLTFPLGALAGIKGSKPVKSIRRKKRR